MKRKSYRPKRVTLLSLILRAAVVVAFLTLLFHDFFRLFIVQELTRKAEEEIGSFVSLNGKQDQEISPEQSLMRLRLITSAAASDGTNYCIELFDYLFLNKSISLSNLTSPDYRYVTAMVDENDEILFTNQMKLFTFLKFSEDETDKAFYVCDDEQLHLPEVDQLYADYQNIYAAYRTFTEAHCTREEAHEENHAIVIELKSVYIDRDSYTFIPHEGVIRLVEQKSDDHYNEAGELDPALNEVELQRQEIHIDMTGNGYELVELEPKDSGNYPTHGTVAFYGVEPEFIEKQKHSFTYTFYSTRIQWAGRGTNTRTIITAPTVTINGKQYKFHKRLTFNLKDKQIVGYIMRYTILFGCFAMLFAAIWVWRRHTLNKARYAFEDYQRDLTNHLAHDIKTPLMAIGGYAENLIESDLTAEERTRYLHSILDNVAFTDSIISRTLQLGSMEQADPRKREQLQAESLIEAGFRKYAPLLEEKQITYSITGSSTITVNRDSFEMLIENLISNAVKYTPEHGTIEAMLGKKRITMTNTVTEQIDTKKLTQPFVRGDKARSNTQGSGLGLSLAERAAESNRMKLVLSCTGTAFRAELRIK